MFKSQDKKNCFIIYQNVLRCFISSYVLSYDHISRDICLLLNSVLSLRNSSTVTINIVSFVRNKSWQHIRQHQLAKHRIKKKGQVQAVRETSQTGSGQQRPTIYAHQHRSAHTPLSRRMIRERTKTRNIFKECYVCFNLPAAEEVVLSSKMVAWDFRPVIDRLTHKTSMWKRIERKLYHISLCGTRKTQRLKRSLFQFHR